MQIGSSLKHAPNIEATFTSFKRARCLALARNSFFMFSETPGRNVTTATKLQLHKKLNDWLKLKWERYIHWFRPQRVEIRKWNASSIYLSPFVSHRCNSPNAPLPSFSTMIKECLGNSFNCCMSSSVDSASISLQDVNRFPVLDECKLPVDGVNAVLQMAVVA